MKPNYIIKKTKNANFEYIVFSTNDASPDDYIEAVGKELHTLGYHGDVIFDLLICNGIEDRFYTAKFDGYYISKNSFKKVHLNSDLLKFATKFYADEKEILENSNLSNMHQYLISKEKIQYL